MIENQPNELTLIYHSDKPDDKKARAFIESITDYVVKTLDLKKESLTETQLAEIANKMDVRIELLVDFTYKDRFQMKDSASIHEVSDADLLTLLTQMPILIKAIWWWNSLTACDIRTVTGAGFILTEPYSTGTRFVRSVLAYISGSYEGQPVERRPLPS